MTYPYTSGQVVTANDLNSGGLHLITPTSVTGGTLSGATVTVTSGASSLVIAGVFSSDFENYKVIFNNYAASSAVSGVEVNLQLDDASGAITSNYYTAQYRVDMSSGSLQVYRGNPHGHLATALTSGGVFSSGGTLEIFSPNIGDATSFAGRSSSANLSGFQNVTYGGIHGGSSIATGFRLNISSGTFHSLRVRVYGYSNG